MPDDDLSFAKVIGIIAALLTSIWIFIQINNEINLVGGISTSLINIWIWFNQTKLPLSWIILFYIVYLIGKPILSRSLTSEKIIERPNISLQNELKNNVQRLIVSSCTKPKTANTIYNIVIKKFMVDSIDIHLKLLERYGGLVFNKDDKTWHSTNEAIEILRKYHGNI